MRLSLAALVLLAGCQASPTLAACPRTVPPWAQRECWSADRHANDIWSTEQPA